MSFTRCQCTAIRKVDRTNSCILRSVQNRMSRLAPPNYAKTIYQRSDMCENATYVILKDLRSQFSKEIAQLLKCFTKFQLDDDLQGRNMSP